MKGKHLLYASIVILILALGFWYSSGQEENPVDVSRPSETSTAAGSGWTEEDGCTRYYLSDGTPASGWTEIDGVLHYFTDGGMPAAGWTEADGKTYYFCEDGTVAAGWLHIDGLRCYLLEDGTPASGWTEIDGIRCYFGTNGTPMTGWTEIDGNRYYLNINGAPVTGTQVIDGETYYFAEDGTFYNGWITIDSKKYYCLGDGSFAVGPTVIDGETYYFSPSGVNVILVNPWNELPADYQANLLPLENGHLVEVSCYQDLQQMLADCEASGFTPSVCSAYRTQADQEYLYQRKVKYYLDLNYAQEEAEKWAATVVALPGTSEHQLGLAVDIIEEDYPYLTDAQANTDTQKWLMEHCWEYGFILRYPEDAMDITGIIWEPWHYRYVGKEIAAEIYAQGITLEEYLGFTP